VSTVQPTNVKKLPFVQNVNDGSWRPQELLWTDATGTAVWVKLRNGDDLVVLITDATGPPKPNFAPEPHYHNVFSDFSAAPLGGSSTSSTIYAQLAATLALSTPVGVGVGKLAFAYAMMAFEAHVTAGTGTVSLAESGFGIGLAISREVPVTSIAPVTITLIGDVQYGLPASSTFFLQGKVDLAIHTLTIDQLDYVFWITLTDADLT